MSLDLHKTAGQLEASGRTLAAQRDAWADRLRAAAAVFDAVDQGALSRRGEAFRRTVAFATAGAPEGLRGRYAPPPAPTDHQVLATDGSHIEADRHHPPRCLLINVGSVRLQYGSHPDAALSSAPRIYSDEDGLILRDPASLHEITVEGAVLAAKRSADETEALAELCENARPDLPALALVDGTLVLWSLGGNRDVDQFLRSEILQKRYLPALDRIQALADTRPLGLAAYISLPQAKEVASLLRLAPALCPYPEPNCVEHCRTLRAGSRSCDVLQGIADRDLLAGWLRPGERSDVFASHASVLDQYGDHRVRFYYVNNGAEMARVEVPEWVATNKALLDLTHSLVMDQCAKGQGYPVALMEAHEQAVVGAGDRRLFHEMVDNLLERRGMARVESEKARSKQTRWV